MYWFVLIDGFEVVVCVFVVEGGCGVNVMVLFKLDVYVFVDMLLVCVVVVGVVNMLCVDVDGCFYGDNIDGVGFVCDIEVNFGVLFVGVCILLFGVGGVVCGVVLLLFDCVLLLIGIVNCIVSKVEVFVG